MSGDTVTGEMDLTLTLPGDVESLRPRIVAALERLGYRVTGDNPVQAKCKSRGWGLMSSTVFDYPRRLAVHLKPASEGSALATFDYEVLGTVPPPGWRKTLTREAEAVVALAVQSLRPDDCRICGAEASAESRFCRQCGAPQSLPEPAEVEVLRLTAQAEAARLSIILGAIVAAIMFAILLALSFANAPIVAALLIGGALTGAAMFFNLRRLQRALYPAEDDTALIRDRQKQIGLPETNALLQAPPPVTENTTDLLRQSDEGLPARPHNREST
ncbi:MAG: zinc ribbon domain-containing protein [Blastocatellia bacterium]|nr:zinc ribbon domain-containing protein [Blastocatellia bacterium]